MLMQDSCVTLPRVTLVFQWLSVFDRLFDVIRKKDNWIKVSPFIRVMEQQLSI